MSLLWPHIPIWIYNNTRLKQKKKPFKALIFCGLGYLTIVSILVGYVLTPSSDTTLSQYSTFFFVANLYFDSLTYNLCSAKVSNTFLRCSKCLFLVWL
jgi:hypothetical protein